MGATDGELGVHHDLVSELPDVTENHALVSVEDAVPEENAGPLGEAIRASVECVLHDAGPESGFSDAEPSCIRVLGWRGVFELRCCRWVGFLPRGCP